MGAPYCVEDPLPLLYARAEARIYRDVRGEPLYAHSGYDAQWRFDVSLDAISAEAIQATLVAEDANFYHHSGVDYRAIVRAFFQNLTAGRIVSGASTISMQVASLAVGRRRSLWGKFLQAARARKMERLHSKEEILTAYLNHAPYGGKITGIEAAAQYYFNTSAKDLTLAESTLLCGIPQRPNKLRLDRHFTAARERQRRLLQMLVRKGVILTQKEADEIFLFADVRCRDYQQPAVFQQLAKRTENYHALLANYPIRSDWQAAVLALLRQQCQQLVDVEDGACVVLDRRHPEKPVLYIGTLDFHHPRHGQVDAARAQRSAGSILKPFFYAAAIQGGRLAPDTQLLDAPLHYQGYTPTNYEATFRGWVSAQEALADSLNTPVIRLLEALGEDQIKAIFKRLELPLGKATGLTLALGTGGVSLHQLVSAYHSLDTVFSPETASLIASMLRRPLPRTTLDIAWKTGTANNNTDAWCVGWTPDYVVGVWFGNKEGYRSEALVGVTAAAPIVGEVFNLLYHRAQKPFWDLLVSTETLCKHSGLRASIDCKALMQGYVHPKIPLLVCSSHQGTASGPLILSPLATNYRGPLVTLPLLSSSEETRWFLNGQPVSPPALTLSPGHYTLLAITAERSESITFTIFPDE